MTAHVAEARDEAACRVALNRAAGVVAVGWMSPRHGKHTFAAVSPAADTVVVHIEVADVGSGMTVLHRERCCVALPRRRLPASSSRSCACSDGV
jgi:hypothetical protein